MAKRKKARKPQAERAKTRPAPVAFGSYLRAARLKRGLTLSEVSQALPYDTSYQIIWNMENEVRTVGIKYIRPLARILRVSEKDLRRRICENAVMVIFKKYGLEPFPVGLKNSYGERTT